MIKRFISSLFAGLCFALFVSTNAFADVVINEANFPDANFRKYLLGQEYGYDGVITDAEMATITSMSFWGDPESLEGIKFFTSLKELNLWDCRHMQSLDVSGCTALTTLSCIGGNLETLNVSGCTALTSLVCTMNKLTTLNVSTCTALTTFDCSENDLTTLNVSGCTALTNLDCAYNELTSLDVSGCTILTNLDCHWNNLTTLNVSGCTALNNIICHTNMLRAANADVFIGSLPNKNGKIYFRSSYDTDANVCTKSQVAAMKEKGWTPYYSNGDNYSGVDDFTGIADISLGFGANAVVYDLNGNRVEDWQNKRGVYIINGKKVVVK
ncbi:MAG: hypothetical protein J1F13_06310 [Prevotellaceae bacterium]|nr:hypothetical protein [Prevotellaceae bacterium]